jgi:hypothetical protein
MFAKIASHAVILLLAACAGREPSFPAEAAGRYQLDYSGVYGVGRVALLLQDGQVRGPGAGAGGITYQGFYRWAPDVRLVALDLIAHLPPFTSAVDGVRVVGTARDVPVQFELPPDLAPGARWPLRIGTQHGPVSGTLTRLDVP